MGEVLSQNQLVFSAVEADVYDLDTLVNLGQEVITVQ